MLSAAAPGQKKRKRGGEVEVVVCPSAFPDFSTVGGSTSRRLERSRRGRDNVDDDNRRRGFQGRGGGGGGGGGGRVGRYARDRKGGKDDDDGGSPPELDVQETIREIHKFGAEGFTGAMRKNHQNAEYEKLTGRTTKRQKIPTKILVGMRQKATKREDRRKREERESGVVGSSSSSSQGTTTTTTTTTKKKRGAKNDKRPSDDAKRGGGAAVGPRGVFGSNRARNTGDRRKMSSRSFGPSPDVGFMLKGILKVKQPPGGGRR
jgi:hypothetical protein